MKNATFLRKNGDPPKRVVDFLRERETHSETQSWKSSRILRVSPNFFFFSLFIIFLHFAFSHFFLFLFFSFLFLHFSSFFFTFSFSFLVCSKSDFFLASIASRFLVTFFSLKKMCLSRLGRYLFSFFFLYCLYFFKRKSFLFFDLFFLFLFSFFSQEKKFLLFFLVFLSNMFHSWHQCQSLTVSFVVGATMEMWCVLTTQGGVAGIGLGHLLGREHDSTPQSGVEAPRLLKRSLPRLYYGCCCCCCFCCCCF